MLALGKAAPAMLRGAAEVLGARIRSAFLVSRADCLGNARVGWSDLGGCCDPGDPGGPGDPGDPGSSLCELNDLGFPLEIHVGGHPEVNEASLVAGAALLKFIQRIPEAGRLLFLISGGASALLEQPRPGGSLVDLQRLTREAFAAGWGIVELNRARAQLSALKGGGLLRVCGDRRLLQLLISDVPDDDPQTIASGPLVLPDWMKTSAQLVDSHFPDWLLKVIRNIQQSIDNKNEIQNISATYVVANNARLRQAVRAALLADWAVQPGVRMPSDLSDGLLDQRPFLVEDAGLLPEAFDAALELLERTVRQPSTPGVVRATIWGGEAPVALPEPAGRGGRARHLALALAARLAGVSGWSLLASASDGSDGSDLLAGAVVDGETVLRAQQAGLEVRGALQAADSGSLLAELGLDFATGSTGTNVMDVFVLLRWKAGV